MRRMTLAHAILTALLATVGPIVNNPDKVSDYHCETSGRETKVNVGDVHAAYGARSVAIMTSALARNTDHLSGMVSPGATFTVFKGDVGIGPRSAGPSAAVDFTRQLAPQSYQFSERSSGPFSMDPCGSVTTELTLFGARPDEAVIAKFIYLDGLLTEVRASQVKLVSGSLETPINR
jgi:hypothetical protein